METGGVSVFLLLLSALVIVFLAAQLFTNALETLGERMGVSEGVTGSVFAAVGTAMPETIVPIVAIVAGGAAIEVNHAVGMGAILGAPFMLATLSLCLMAVAAGVRFGWEHRFTPESGGLSRDLRVFAVAFSLVLLAGLLPPGWDVLHLPIAAGLVGLYLWYLWRTVRASGALVEEGHGTAADEPLYLARWLGNGLFVAVLQLILGLLVLVIGARMFVHGIEEGAALLSVSALVISLLLVPVATELPEKVNSILWIRRRRDTLAFGNITGAMVFQGTVIPAIGMSMIPWRFTEAHAVGAVLLALGGAAWLWFLHASSRLSARLLLGNGVLYACFVGLVAWLS